MKLTVLGSSSSGNGYILHNENEALIIEAGVKLTQLKQALNFNISHIAGCLISHSHNDHAGYLEGYAKAGITILTSNHVLQSKNNLVASTLCKVVLPGKGYKIGSFKVIPFELKHDVPCLGFLVDHPESGKLAFITDSFLCEYTFNGLNHLIIEVNYSDDILGENIESGYVHPSMKPRLLSTHMELETAKGIIRANDNPGLLTILLVHLSNGNSNEEMFVREIRQLTGKQVYAARSGMTIEMNKEPF